MLVYVRTPRTCPTPTTTVNYARTIIFIAYLLPTIVADLRDYNDLPEIPDPEEPCLTARGFRKGFCVTLTNCPSLYHLVHSEVLTGDILELFKDSLCENDGNYLLVCCDREELRTMRLPLTGNTCTTPDGHPGMCRHITECFPIWNALRIQSENGTISEYIEKSYCYPKKIEPFVCCPLSGILFQSTTTTTTTTTPPTTSLVEPDDPLESTSSMDYIDQGELVMYTGEDDCEMEGTCWVDNRMMFATKSLLLPEDCGRIDTNRKFTYDTVAVGNKPSTIVEFPWVVLLGYMERGFLYFRCNGVLINERYILTAAHCVNEEIQKEAGKLVSVRFGEFDLVSRITCETDSCNDPPEDYEIEEIVPHSDYIPSSKNQYHDIALIRLKQAVRFSKYIQPICLLNDNKTLEIGDIYTVAGWGQTKQLRRANVKVKLEVPIVPMETCKKFYSQSEYDFDVREDFQICAGGEVGKDTCRGDSGAPLMRSITDPGSFAVWYAAGIVSFGPTPCGQPGWPGIYTNIPFHTEWILSQLRK